MEMKPLYNLLENKYTHKKKKQIRKGRKSSVKDKAESKGQGEKYLHYSHSEMS